MDIKKGNIIKIGKDKYDVLSVVEEIDRYNTEKNEFVGEHTAIELHKFGDSSLHATHLLKIYHKKNEAILLRIKYYNLTPTEWLKRPRQAGIVNYYNKKTILLEGIQIESSTQPL